MARHRLSTATRGYMVSCQFSHYPHTIGKTSPLCNRRILYTVALATCAHSSVPQTHTPLPPATVFPLFLVSLSPIGRRMTAKRRQVGVRVNTQAEFMMIDTVWLLKEPSVMTNHDL